MQWLCTQQSRGRCLVSAVALYSAGLDCMAVLKRELSELALLSADLDSSV